MYTEHDIKMKAYGDFLLNRYDNFYIAEEAKTWYDESWEDMEYQRSAMQDELTKELS